MAIHAKATSVRLNPEKLAALEALGRAVDRDRSYLINEAIDAYLAINRWQLEHIARGLEQADKGEFASDAEVDAAYARWK